MSIGRTLIAIGVALTIAPALFGHYWWFFAVEAFVKLLAVALISDGGL